MRLARRIVSSGPALSLSLAALLLGLCSWPRPTSSQQPVDYPSEPPVDVYPYFMQPPVIQQQPQQPLENQNLVATSKQQRASIPGAPLVSPSVARNSQSPAPAAVPASNIAPGNPPNNFSFESKPLTPKQEPTLNGCTYDKNYFLKLDQCLERKPYPTIGLAAFKNEDLMIKKGLSDKYGCSFILTNGLFKSYQISKYALDSDSQCLDQDQTSQLSVHFSNVTLYYLWQLRCLNYANQLLDDSTLNGKTLSNNIYSSESVSSTEAGDSICVGSSQSFGFAALQMSSIESQVELSVDIYKNWRVTNVTVAMLTPSSKLGDHQQAGDYHEQQSHAQQHERGSTGIKEFTFDTIDGDELNWRYAHLYENWTRNRLHVNFLDQFKRFLWVSLQRCLGESSARLPTKFEDLFGTHKYN